MTKLLLALIIVIATLAGCASAGEAILKAGTTGSIRFNPDDLDAAIETAKAVKDPQAETCFKALKNHVAANPEPIVRGPVSAYMAARTKTREIRAGLAPDVHIACSPLIVDAGTFTSSFGLLFR